MVHGRSNYGAMDHSSRAGWLAGVLHDVPRPRTPEYPTQFDTTYVSYYSVTARCVLRAMVLVPRPPVTTHPPPKYFGPPLAPCAALLSASAKCVGN